MMTLTEHYKEVADRAFNWHRTGGPTEIAELREAVKKMIEAEEYDAKRST